METRSNERKWTPGPWIMGGAHVYARSDQPSVAVVVRYREEWEANCDLIAAAPDLYEALMCMISCEDPHHVMDAKSRAHAALAKARGEK